MSKKGLVKYVSTTGFHNRTYEQGCRVKKSTSYEHRRFFTTYFAGYDYDMIMIFDMLLALNVISLC